jgi:hypothetical protein
MITDKQAKCLDALREGGTIYDVMARLDVLKPQAFKILASLTRGDLLRYDGETVHVQGDTITQTGKYTHTEKGKAVWLSSLR